MHHEIANRVVLVALLGVGLAMPLLAQDQLELIARLWVFMVLALGWNLSGGQAGYASLGNVAFFGIGMYTAALLQAELHDSVVAFAAFAPAAAPDSDAASSFGANGMQAGLVFGVGVLGGGLTAMLTALILGGVMLSLGAIHFAMATLGLVLAAAELAANGRQLAVAPLMTVPASGAATLYWWSYALAVLALIVFMRLQHSRLRLALNAIRDDEDKARAMGRHTLRDKLAAWAIAAFFTGMVGAIHGHLQGGLHLIGSVHEAAFGIVEIGAWVILMAMLGGRSTFWGPVIGAVALFGVRELLTVLLPGWQLVVAGALLVVVAVFLPDGMSGWLRARRCRRAATQPPGAENMQPEQPPTTKGSVDEHGGGNDGGGGRRARLAALPTLAVNASRRGQRHA